MTHVRFLLSNLVYLVYAALWAVILLYVNRLSGAAWYVKGLITVLLVFVTPTLEGPWRYSRYLRSWTGREGS